MLKSITYEAEKADELWPLLNWVIDVKTDPADKRDHIQFAVAAGGWIHRTNGAMLKSVRVEGIEDGCYLPIKKASTIILKHSRKPEDMRQPCPDFEKLYQLTPGHTNVVVSGYGDVGWMKTLAEVIIGTRGVFNSAYFASLSIGFSGHVYYAGPEDMIFFLGERADEDVDQKGALMPMRF
ncbi:MAG: hypothetical protein MUC33_01160 [Desulfobacterales bacterium]|jgi:hypothetical protein|nr:hypothetical protein [Desulfobacterales bacterium]MCU0601251.1 hypothetical protein [Desulfobacterales bacterium]